MGGNFVAINVKSFSELIEKDVFTTKGVYSGKISDMVVDLDKFRVQSIVVDAIKGSFMAGIIGNKRGITVPYQMIQSIGDVVIIKHVTPVSMDEPETPAPDDDEEE